LRLGRWVVDVPFAQGTLAMGRPGKEPFPEEDTALLERFTGVFALAYARFLDFQQLEEQNAQIREANRLKSDFLNRMSHDLRTPMNAIKGYVAVLLRKTRDTLEGRQYANLEKIKQSSENMLKRVRRTGS
jgi:signal transduction histidine kinase